MLAPLDKAIELNISKVDLEAFAQRTICQGEPLIMADPMRIMRIGQRVSFCQTLELLGKTEEAYGTITREVERTEYMAWKQRCFGDCGFTEEVEGCKFFEVVID